MIYTFVQHIIDTENTIYVPGLIEDEDFPKAALALSAVAVWFYYDFQMQIFIISRSTVLLSSGKRAI